MRFAFQQEEAGILGVGDRTVERVGMSAGEWKFQKTLLGDQFLEEFM